jgi:transposase
MNYEAIIAEKVTINLQLRQENIELKYQLAKLQRMLFGRKSERHVTDPYGGPNLFSDQLPPVTAPEPEVETISYERKKNANHKGRRLIDGLPADLQRVIEIIELEGLPESTVRIGEEQSNKLGYKPGKFFIAQQIRPKYKDTLTEQICIAPKPEQAIDKCEADTTLLAYSVVSKFVDHTPEHRQLQIFKRDGVNIPSSSYNGWTHAVADYITPIVAHIRKSILDSGYIQMDESTIKVLKTDHQGLGYMWVTNDPKSRMVSFDFHPSRSKEVPKQILIDYSGKIQTDAYSAYKSTVKDQPELDQYGCMAHARRKFVEAENNDKQRSHYLIKELQKLYAIEQRCRDEGMTDLQRKNERAEHSIPILKAIKDWLDDQILKVVPNTPIGKAMAYSLNNWLLLQKYAYTGDVEIDNNLVENAIRPLALGRKNYLFAGSPEAVHNIAKFYTLFGCCKALQINPYDYLKWILDTLPKFKITDIHQFTPLAYSTHLGKLES